MIKYLLLAITIAVPLWATGAQASNLLTVYQAAKTFDTTFAAACAAYRAGQEKKQQATALWLPKVNLTANATQNQNRERNSQYWRNQDTRSTTTGYGVVINQPLYDTQVSVGSEQLNDQAKLAEVQFASDRQDLMLRVTKAYMDVLLAQDKLDLVQAQKQAYAEQLDQAKQSYDAGVSTIIDVQEAQARYDNTAASEIAAQNELNVNQNAFTQLTGVSAEELDKLDPHMVATAPQPADLNQWLARGAAHGLKIEAKRLALAIKAAEPHKYGAWHESTLNLQLGYNKDRQQDDAATLDKTEKTYVGINLNIPLFTGGGNRSKLREALAEKEQASDELESARRETALEVKRDYLGVTAGAAQINALQQALTSAQSALDSTKLGREVGTRTTLDVLNAEQQLYSTRKDLAEARYTYLQNRLKLAAAVGDLSLADLQTANAALHA